MVKSLLVLVIVVASFTAALLLRSGGVTALTAGEPAAVAAGDFKFAYPKAWKPIAKGDLPMSAGTSVKGSVVAGLCPPAKQSCTANADSELDMSYMLFEEGETFPSVATLEEKFDTAFPKKFQGFEKVSAKVVTTADGSRYLRYEFLFTKNGRQHQEIIGAYRAQSKGVVVVATGPTAQFAEHREEVIGILDGAREH